MSLVQEEKLGGNSLTFADKCRKGLAKKDGPLFKECEEEYYKNAKEKGCSEKLVHYVWEELLAVQRGYSFNRSHCLAYSLMGLQEMNLAYKFPIIFWNTACLITDSGALEDNGNTNYGKVAKALGTILSRGIEVSLVNINESNYIFEPDVKNNRIMFGMQAVNGLNSSAIEQIIENRPYVSFTDFMNRCSLNKTAMVSLIKSGAFDGLEKEWSEELGVNPRIVIMSYYLLKISGQKTKITMQNFSGLIKKELIPDKLNFHKKLFEFNKYIKAYKKKENYYVLDESSCLKFYKTFFDEDNLSIIGGTPCVYQKLWDKLYKKKMATAKQWIEEYQDEILKEFNYLLFKEQWDKYASGNISSWEMDSLCFYYHDHELKNINKEKYGVENFFNLSEDAEVDYWFKRGNNQIPIYKLRKIAGTVIEKDDNHSSISLLTVEGVVTVKFSKDNYALYAKQIAEENNEGVKEVKEKSWFSRGTKLLLTGYRRDNTFVIKTYKNTPTHQVYLISDVKSNGDLELSHLRYGQSEV
jgi:DNA polymerase-3 subunit alpha